MDSKMYSFGGAINFKLSQTFLHQIWQGYIVWASHTGEGSAPVGILDRKDCGWNSDCGWKDSFFWALWSCIIFLLKFKNHYIFFQVTAKKPRLDCKQVDL